MALPASNYPALKSDIAANVNTVLFQGSQQAINTLPNTGDANFAIAKWYNQAASPAYIVWRDVAMETVLNTVTFANMTPVDAVPTSDTLATSIWQARSLSCQGKQFNLQNLTIGRTVAPMKRTNYRSALQDCLTQLPSGTNGALLAANWVGVRDAAKFSATNIEKLLATGAGTSANPSDLSFEGKIDLNDVENARNS